MPKLTFVEGRLFPIPFPPLERLDRYQARRTRSTERVVPIESLLPRRELVRHPPHAIVLPELDAAFARRGFVKAARGAEDDRAEPNVRIRCPQVGEEAPAGMS